MAPLRPQPRPLIPVPAIFPLHPWQPLPQEQMWPVWCLAGLLLFGYLFTSLFSKPFFEVGGRGEELTAIEQ